MLKGSIVAAQCDPSGGLVAVATQKGVLMIYDMLQLEEIFYYEAGFRVSALSWHPSGKYIGLAGEKA